MLLTYIVNYMCPHHPTHGTINQGQFVLCVLQIPAYIRGVLHCPPCHRSHSVPPPSPSRSHSLSTFTRGQHWRLTIPSTLPTCRWESHIPLYRSTTTSTAFPTTYPLTWLKVPASKTVEGKMKVTWPLTENSFIPLTHIWGLIGKVGIKYNTRCHCRFTLCMTNIETLDSLWQIVKRQHVLQGFKSFQDICFVWQMNIQRNFSIRLRQFYPVFFIAPLRAIDRHFFLFHAG